MILVRILNLRTDIYYKRVKFCLFNKKVFTILFVITLIISITIFNKQLPPKTDQNKQQYINVKEYGAKGDGITDDTQSLKNAFQIATKEKIKEIIFPKGKYVISQPIKIINSIILKGNDSTIILSKSFNSNKIGQGFFYAKLINNIKIYNLNFDGNKDNLAPDPTNNFVIWFQDSSNILVENCHVVDLNGRGKNLNTAFGFVGQSNNIEVKNNLFENSNGGAVFFQGKHSIAKQNVAIRLNDVAYVANGKGAKDITIENNVASTVSSGSIGIENGPSDIYINSNRIYNFTDGYGIGILQIKDNSKELSKNVFIENNLIDENKGTNPSNGIAVVNGENVIVKKNKIKNVRKNNPHNNSIYVSDESNYVKIFYNLISNTNAPKIVNNSSKGIIIEKNAISH
ncbi:hypothetical protein EWH99_13515 [Sporolactobacillus sp. THM7-7]|nr:hypothetical protein EWH99_13515 [Sporolactobacillus sp. THM7-7]